LVVAGLIRLADGDVTAVNTKILIGTAAGVLVAGAVAGAGYFTLAGGGEELRHKTQHALRTAVPSLAAAELQTRGHPLAKPLTCRDLPGWTKQRMRVGCTGSTTAGKPVEVIGSAERTTAREYFTILVNGRPLVENAGCLATDCKD
jgi:hypothetical protein